MRQILKYIIVIQVFLFVCSSFAACKNTESEDIVLQITLSEEFSQPFINAVDEYEKLYSGRKVEVNFYNDTIDQRETEISALKGKIMAGDGPDIIVYDSSFALYCDIQKMCMSGAFEDLMPYFESDKSWSWENYTTKVIEGGQFDGKQYMMPLYYSIPVLVTSEEALENSGFDLANCDTGVAFLQEWQRYEQMRAVQSDLPVVFSNPHSFSSLGDLNALDLNPLNYDNRKVVWPDLCQTAVELYQQLYQTDIAVSSDAAHYSLKSVVDGNRIFANPSETSYMDKQFTAMMTLLSYGDTPVMQPLYTADGDGISAKIEMAAGVSRTSQYKEECYDFIKCLLSENAQKAYQKLGDGLIRQNYFTPVHQGLLSSIADVSGYSEKSTAKLTNEEQITLKGLPEQYFEQYQKFTEQITNAYFDGEFTIYYFNPYFRGEMDYQVAQEEVDKQLDIYISE